MNRRVTRDRSVTGHGSHVVTFGVSHATTTTPHHTTPSVLTFRASSRSDVLRNGDSDIPNPYVTQRAGVGEGSAS